MGESFTIQISSNLVNRLVDDGEKLKRKTKKSQAKISREVQKSPANVRNREETHKGTAAAGWPIQPPLFLPVPPSPHSANEELDGIRSVLQESERVLERLQKHEGDMVQEVTQRAKDLHDKEFKLPYHKPMACLAEKDACLECYKENANNALKCAPLVKNFADCARRVRQLVGSPAVEAS
ncbi:uncharacterized protein LOC131164616 isoform X2 [Malania oleifera]|nr:uncharacterized protein LOC131164616 isoform X2 [Malania oleifera]